MSSPKDLSKEAPRSPRQRIGGYVVIARMIDKGRALLHTNLGEYHFDCPLDNMLFEFKGVKGDDVKKELASGASDEAVAQWITSHGTAKTPAEIKEWADGLEAYRPYDNPEKKDWFAEQCAKIGLDPAKVTMFDWLEADDRASFKK